MTTELVLRPRDPLDLPEARRLVREVEALSAGTRVALDVSTTREIHPAGLAYVAYALARDGRVALRGLSRRHERLLAYLVEEHWREALSVTNEVAEGTSRRLRADSPARPAST